MNWAAKKKTFVLMLIASAWLFWAPAIASSISLEGPKNRAEQLSVGSVKRDLNYDVLGGTASDCLVGLNNQLLSDGEFNYQYDVEGNQILRTNIATGETTEFEYDHRNRLVKTTVKSSGGIITSESQYVFDVFGRRIAVINDADGAGPGEAVRENFIYDGDNAWADYNEAGEAVARYLFGDGIDSNVARWRAGEGTAWYLTDHLGTVRGVVDAVGILVNQTTYDSFGQVLNETNSLLGDRYKFTGRELNSGSDYYYRARQYSASSGRFGSLDPIRFGGNDGNLYRYGLNRVNSITDPSGNALVENASVRTLVIVVNEAAFFLGCFLGDLGDTSDDGLAGGGAQELAERGASAAVASTIAVSGGVFALTAELVAVSLIAAPAQFALVGAFTCRLI